MGKRGGYKDPFADLDDDFKNAVQGMGSDELHKRLADVTKDEAINQANKKADQDLKSKMTEAQEAGKQYRDGTKFNSLRARYLIRALSDRGDAKANEVISISVISA